ncbi:SRPBCC family protein [Lacihabitans sp. LS3-19]|uniref:SRPBCC family protein n=1 Tax=Lacihabitans sp. LS3-19 TaxID=2487335 RepID=UPI0020CD460C|nr:SRPBCC family protein [Lacihabitans sp. LS3-19]MCP9769879.1 SRPBCC family protein [Lacihabitans sp. LS3-19]
MTQTFTINKPPNLIFEYLTDMEKFVSVHPVISKMDDRGGENYLVHETLKLGFIPFSFTYPVIIEKNEQEKQVKILATVMKMTKIEMEFNLKKDGDYTVVTEQISFKSPLPIKFIMKSIFRKQHTQLFKNIEKLKRIPS